MCNRTIRWLLVALLTTFGAASTQAQVSGTIERIARGFGQTFKTLDSSSWQEIGRVTIKTKSAGFCAVTASFTTNLPQDTTILVSLSQVPDNQGPWLQAYENEAGASEWNSGGMTQTFEVGANSVEKFYLVGSRSSGGDPSIELTRIWATCGVGNAQGLTAEEEETAQIEHFTSEENDR